jgi:hypothetical protein
MKYNDLSAKRTEIDFTSGGEFEGTPTAEKISSNKVALNKQTKVWIKFWKIKNQNLNKMHPQVWQSKRKLIR